MFLKKNNLLKSTAIYAGTEALNKGINFLLLPWLSYYLIPSELGIVTNYNICFTILNLLSSTVFVSFINYFFYENTRKATKSLISSIVFLAFIVTIFFFVFVLFFNKMVYEQLGIGLDFQLLLLVHIFMTTFNSILSAIYRLKNRPLKFAVFQIIQISVNISLLILLVIVYKFASQGRIVGMAMTSIVMGSVSFIILLKSNYFGPLNRNILKKVLHFSLPLTPYSVSYWFKNGSDKIIITMFCGLSVNGTYSMALSICSVFTTLINSFNNAFTPTLQKRLSKMDNMPYSQTIPERRDIVKQVYKYALGFVLLFFLCYLGTELCFKIVISKKYFESQVFLPWLLLGLLFDAFYSLTIQYIYKAKRTVGLGIITFSCSTIQVLVTYFLVKWTGAIGAAYSSVIMSLITFLSITYYSVKVYPMPWNLFYKNNNQMV